MKSPFVVNVAPIRGHSGSRLEFAISGCLDGLAVSGSSISEQGAISFAGAVEGIEGRSVVVSGLVRAHWVGPCRRCLCDASGEIAETLTEVFQSHAVEGETYPLSGDTVDLEPMVREALVLALPEAPLCAVDCAGLCVQCGTNLNTDTCGCTAEAGDPRWAALEELKDSLS